MPEPSLDKVRMLSNDELRPRLDEENTKKVRAWENQLRSQGVIMSPQRIVNLLIANIDFFEINQVLKVEISEPYPTAGGKKKRKRLIIKTNVGKTF